MTAHADNPWVGRWSVWQTSPAMDLCQRKPWDMLAPADQASADARTSEEADLSLEVAVSGDRKSTRLNSSHG